MKNRQAFKKFLILGRRCRNFLFKELGYLCLQSPYTAHTHDQQIAYRNEVVEAKQNVIYLVDGDRIDFAY